MVVKKKAAAKKAEPKKKPVTSKKAAAKKAAPKKAAAKKAAPKKAAVKKAAPKKAAAKKAAPKKAAVKKAVTKKPATTRATNKAAMIKPKTKMATTPVSTLSNPISLHGVAPYKEKRGETYMNDDHTAHFRAILKNWKRELMEEVDRTVHHMQDEAANFPDPNDRASQESEFALELRTRDRERKLIKKIDESLADLESDDYGYCDVCGVEIGIRRLEARPTATQCIDCKTLDEIREKQSRV
jgi:DnaK suppressor protein